MSHTAIYVTAPPSSSSGRITRQGLPAANTACGMSRVTTLPAPITARDPMRTPGRMMAPPPIHTSEPISTGLPNSVRRRRSASSGVHRGVDLHGRSNEGVVTDADVAHVQDDAVEVEEDTFAQVDVRAVIAEERRLHPHRVPTGAEQVAEQAPALLLRRLACGIERLAQVAGAFAAGDELGIEGIIQLAGEHLLAFRHGTILGHGASGRNGMTLGAFHAAARQTFCGAGARSGAGRAGLAPLVRV